MNPDAFIELIAHEKLAARNAEWLRRSEVNRQLFAELATASGVPGSVKRMAKERLAPPRRAVVTHTCLDGAGGQRLLSREELYELVWSEPLLTRSHRFGLPDNGLRKRLNQAGSVIPIHALTIRSEIHPVRDSPHPAVLPT